jgi:hypothetical protein
VHEVAEETASGLVDATADAKRWQEESEGGHREQVEEFTHL